MLLPAFIVLLALPFLGIRSCLAFRALFVSTLVVNLLAPVTLFTLTVERYIGVIHPYSCQTILNKERILLFARVAGSLCVAIVSLLLLNVKWIFVIFGLLLLAFFIFITFAYTRICLIVRQLDGDQPNNASQRRRLFREIRHAKSCFIVVIAYCQ